MLFLALALCYKVASSY